MDNMKQSEAIEAFRRYTDAFQTLSPHAVVPYFNEPAIMITPQGVMALPTGSAVEQAYEHVMAALPAQGYARTEFSTLVEHRLSDDLAIVSGMGTWKKASGEDLQRFAMTYTLRRAARVWRIVVACIHDPDGR
jgi:ketosteroid isomerase-like protein